MNDTDRLRTLMAIIKGRTEALEEKCVSEASKNRLEAFRDIVKDYEQYTGEKLQ